MARKVTSVNIATTSLGLIKRGAFTLFELLTFVFLVIQLHLRDIVYTILAFILPRRPVGKVIPYGKPGYAGLWPEYQPPASSDSRSPCPGLNVLANHGILPRDGRQITYDTMIDAIQHAYNLSPTLAEQLTGSAYLVDQGRGWINLHDLNALNVVQHDASFTRPDIAMCPDQGYPHPDLVDRFLSSASTSDHLDRAKLTRTDFAYYSGVRRAECKDTNGQYSLGNSFLHKFFGSGNAALMYSIWGGDVDDMRIWLGHERFPDNWEPKVRWKTGHTIAFAQATTLNIEFNIYEDQMLRLGDSLMENQKEHMKKPPPFHSMSIAETVADQYKRDSMAAAAGGKATVTATA